MLKTKLRRRTGTFHALDRRCPGVCGACRPDDRHAWDTCRCAGCARHAEREESAALLFMRGGETGPRRVRHALRPVGLRVFSNIAASEQKHTDAVAALLDAYGLEDPTIGNGVGEFIDPPSRRSMMSWSPRAASRRQRR